MKGLLTSLVVSFGLFVLVLIVVSGINDQRLDKELKQEEITNDSLQVAYENLLLEQASDSVVVIKYNNRPIAILYYSSIPDSIDLDFNNFWTQASGRNGRLEIDSIRWNCDYTLSFQ